MVDALRFLWDVVCLEKSIELKDGSTLKFTGNVVSMTSYNGKFSSVFDHYDSARCLCPTAVSIVEKAINHLGDGLCLVNISGLDRHTETLSNNSERFIKINNEVLKVVIVCNDQTGDVVVKVVDQRCKQYFYVLAEDLSILYYYSDSMNLLSILDAIATDSKITDSVADLLRVYAIQNSTVDFADLVYSALSSVYNEAERMRLQTYLLQAVR